MRIQRYNLQCTIVKVKFDLHKHFSHTLHNMIRSAAAVLQSFLALLWAPLGAVGRCMANTAKIPP